MAVVAGGRVGKGARRGDRVRVRERVPTLSVPESVEGDGAGDLSKPSDTRLDIAGLSEIRKPSTCRVVEERVFRVIGDR